MNRISRCDWLPEQVSYVTPFLLSVFRSVTLQSVQNEHGKFADALFAFVF